MSDAVLIVSNSDDIHAERVAAIIIAEGVNCFRLDLDRFPRDYRLSFALNLSGWGGEFICVKSGLRLDIASVSSVWMRKAADFSYSVDLAVQERAFADDEVNHLLLGWLNSLTSYFMSHPVALRSAGWKCEQLIRAPRFGFAVPPSLVTNVAASAREFVSASSDRAIYKTLSTPNLHADKVADEDRSANGLHTTLVRTDDPALDSIEVLPGLFQHYIEKDFEVRVTVVAGQIFAARIDSQLNERTRIDYRHYEADVSYSAHRLPAAVATGCREFVASYGLTYGAIDLIAKRDGAYVFLENNPVGQFVFIEELVPELEISAAVAATLISGG